jgi:hypothetical protein
MSLRANFQKRRIEKLKYFISEFYPDVELIFEGHFGGNYSLEFKGLPKGGPDFFNKPGKPDEYYLNNGRITHSQIIETKMKEIEEELKYTFFISPEEIEKWQDPNYEIIRSIYSEMKRHEAQTNGYYKAKKLILTFEEYWLFDKNEIRRERCQEVHFYLHPENVSRCLIYFGIDLKDVIVLPPPRKIYSLSRY